MHTDTISKGRIPSLVMMDPVSRRVIVYLRLLRTAPAGRTEVEQDLAARAGPESAGALCHLDRLERMMAGLLGRPLDIGCLHDARVTQDELTIAALVAAAAEDRLEDCRLQATELASGARITLLVNAVLDATRGIAAGDAPRCSCGRAATDDDAVCRIQ